MTEDAQPTAPRWLLPMATLVVVAPLLAALVALREPRWVPVLDLAQTELRVRDVGGSHSPLIGLAGRIGDGTRQGSHPGPASFYALAPTYRLLGSSAWALQAATVVIHTVAAAAALWLARRRAGTIGVGAVALVLAVLVVGYGGGPLTEPWNPYLPLLWWLVVLLGTWSALCGDHRVLPLTVAAASFAAQTHIPYLGLGLGMGAVALAPAVWASMRGERTARRNRARWLLAAGGVGLVMWLPPTIEQISNDPGNYSVLIEHFGSPPETPKGLSTGIRLVAQRFDLAHLVQQVPQHPGALIPKDVTVPPLSTFRGGIVLAIWALTAVLALRLGERRLVALHATVATGVLLAVVTLSRVFGTVWFYLMTWVWTLALLAALATGWTLVARLVRRSEQPSADRARRLAAPLLGAAVLLVSLRAVVAAPGTEQSDVELSTILAELLPATVEGLEAGTGPASGRSGTYLVTWSDPVHIGSQGYGLLIELERRGFHVGVAANLRVPATTHRVIDGSDASARLILASGLWVPRWRTVPGVVELAAVDPRDAQGRARFAELSAAVRADLAAEGLGDLVPLVDGDNLFEAAIDERVPRYIERQLAEMLSLGVPTAIFVGPVDAQP